MRLGFLKFESVVIHDDEIKKIKNIFNILAPIEL